MLFIYLLISRSSFKLVPNSYWIRVKTEDWGRDNLRVQGDRNGGEADSGGDAAGSDASSEKETTQA